MARKTPAKNAALATALSGGVDRVSAALHKFDSTYADQVVEAMRNASASRRKMAIQPLRQPQ